jgi:putative transposase
MPRLARTVIVGIPHHITHRGNRRSTIFFADDDRQCYLRLLLTASRKHHLGLWAYCLMSNHVHLLAVPGRADSLAKALGYTHMMHARRVNSRYGWTGHLWANRFYSSPVEPEQSSVVARYIELNPVRARIIERAEDHPWSSARSHCLGDRDPLLAHNRPMAGDCEEWQRWLGQETQESEAAALRRATATGSPFGSEAFVEHLEEVLGRRLRRRGYRSAHQGAGINSSETD